jgi:hypothetical protein
MGYFSHISRVAAVGAPMPLFLNVSISLDRDQEGFLFVMPSSNWCKIDNKLKG